MLDKYIRCLNVLIYCDQWCMNKSTYGRNGAWIKVHTGAMLLESRGGGAGRRWQSWLDELVSVSRQKSFWRELHFFLLYAFYKIQIFDLLNKPEMQSCVFSIRFLLFFLLNVIVQRFTWMGSILCTCRSDNYHNQFDELHAYWLKKTFINLTLVNRKIWNYH